jgi:NAD-dependent DNA ligase
VVADRGKLREHSEREVFVTGIDYDNRDDLLRLYNLPALVKKRIQTLHGMAASIVYDGHVSDEEAAMLVEWLHANADFAGEWPINELCSMLRPSGEGPVWPETRIALLRFLTAIAASPDQQDTAPPSIADDVADVVFEGRSFLFTGKLEMGSRAKAEATVRRLGGSIAPRVSASLSYLVVGGLGSATWTFARYGRKIEDVMMYKRAGAPVLILAEPVFVREVVKADRTTA